MAATPTPLLELDNLRKEFPGTLANDDVSLVIEAGEIHALLGENGAGKSTLVKMIYGVLRPDAGSIRWHGDRIELPNPRAARRQGIGMVFQHFSLFEALSAAENIALSLDDAPPMDQLTERAQQLSERYGLPLDPYAMVGDLSVGERQRIEIVRCLLQEPELLILDEPTSVLTPQEAEQLFATLEQLRSDGKSILYISHRLDEVQRLCDNATVLRGGKVVAHCKPAQESAASLATLMVGSELPEVSHDEAPSSGAVLLDVRALERPAASPFAVALQDVYLQGKAGRILGIAGVAGNGQGELFEALSGEALLEQPRSIKLRGRVVGKMGINARRALGAAFVPEERLGHGAVPPMSLVDNALLSRHRSDGQAFVGWSGRIKRGKLRALANRIVTSMDVRCASTEQTAGALSGGNLQKFIIGRELDRKPSVMVVNQPTWGVDAGAALRIRNALVQLARDGSAVIVISQDLEELLQISDDISVMHDGRLSAPMPACDATPESIGLLMGGAEDYTGASA
ncbi:MAG: ABC transporter ATP-binding protein [Granulosicoccaceae bacterium]